LKIFFFRQQEDFDIKSRYTFEVITKDGLNTQKIKDLIWSKLGEVPDIDCNGTYYRIEHTLTLEGLKVHDMREARGKALTDEMAEQVVKELKAKHPVLAAIIERGHRMDMRETVSALIVLEALQWFLRIHAARLATD
jgi:hypothetical protein